jgi:hypothetical protein
VRAFRASSTINHHGMPFNVELVAHVAIATARDAIDVDIVLAILFDGVFRDSRKRRFEFQAMGLLVERMSGEHHNDENAKNNNGKKIENSILRPMTLQRFWPQSWPFRPLPYIASSESYWERAAAHNSRSLATNRFRWATTSTRTTHIVSMYTLFCDNNDK